MSTSDLTYEYCTTCEKQSLHRLYICTECNTKPAPKCVPKTLYFVTRVEGAESAAEVDSQLCRLGWGRKESPNVFSSQVDAIYAAIKWQKKFPRYTYIVFKVEQLGRTVIGDAQFKEEETT